MYLIKVTSLQTKQPIYIREDAIGHFFEIEEEIEYGRVKTKKHTVIGTTTHNNGGFRVTESVKEIAQKILNAKNELANIVKE
jgi:hypothetical protein